MPIRFYEDLPETRIDHTGVTGNSRSGNEVTQWRCDRSTYRRFLETEIRKLNDFEAEERRAGRGVVVPFKDVVGGH